MIEAAQINCPYCHQQYEISVDCSAGGQEYVEDCPVCCNPAAVTVQVDIDGKLLGVSAIRGND